jgi:predicted Zn-dependent protease
VADSKTAKAADVLGHVTAQHAVQQQGKDDTVAAKKSNPDKGRLLTHHKPRLLFS